MIRMMFRKYSGAWNSIRCCSDQAHVMRPKQPLHLHRKLHAGAGVRRQQLLSNCDVQHTAKNPQFLMDGRRLKPISLNNSAGRS